MPLHKYAVSQYVLSPSLTVKNTVVRSLDSDFVEDLADPAMHLSLNGHLHNLSIKYKEGKPTFSSLMDNPKDKITDLWLEEDVLFRK